MALHGVRARENEESWPLRIMVVAALFPPEAFGGAESSAWNLSTWLMRQGFEVGVFTTATSKAEEFSDRVIDGLRVWRIRTPHIYPIFRFPRAPAWQKPIWHLQDHFDPRNGRGLDDALDTFEPDMLNIHYIQGIGYNALDMMSKRRIPAVFFLHDLGLACARMAMFKDGVSCTGQCIECKVSTAIKVGHIKRFERIGFCSPSRANLNHVSEYFPMDSYPRTSILNANDYPTPTVQRVESKATRFVYVGRIHPQKGVDIVCEAAERLAERSDIELTIVGEGPQRGELEQRFGARSWRRFTGHITQQAVADVMQNCDVLLAPSVGPENSPGVVIHALKLGLPVIGSNIGGIPELVEPGRNGDLAIPGDVDDWTRAMGAVIDDPARLEAWRMCALAEAERFGQDAIGAQILEFMMDIREGRPISSEDTRAGVAD